MKPDNLPLLGQDSSQPQPDQSIRTRLLRSRIITLSSEVNDELANQVIGEMLLLANEDPDKDITMYINSPGGSVSAGMAIYDIMQFIPCNVKTVSIGLSASMGQLLLAAGSPGKRYALPNTRIMMHQPLGGVGGAATEIRIQYEQMKYIKSRLALLIAKHTGQPLERIVADSDRDRWFSAEEAVEYGIVDHLITDAEQLENNE